MAKILILIGGHLCTAPRPQKEAETLANAGHEVTVRGFWFDPALVERDRLHHVQTKKWQFAPIVDFQPQHRFNNLQIRLDRDASRKNAINVSRPSLLTYWAMGRKPCSKPLVKPVQI